MTKIRRPVGSVLTLLLTALALAACQPKIIPTDLELAPTDCEKAGAVTHSVYLIGDAGAPELPAADSNELVDPVLLSLHRDVQGSATQLGWQQVGVLFLGDNVYPKGLAPKGHSDRRRGERVLEAQIAAADPAYAVFTAGNHDWHMESSKGWDWIRAQREFLEGRSERVFMLPPGGCAGPSSIDFGPYLRLVFVDQVGWLHLIDNPDEHRPVCPYADAVEVFRQLQHEFDNPEGHHVLFATHHPLITAGPHGGNFTWKQHLFPLQDFVPWLWIPLPVIGSIYPLSRQLGVTGTDVSSGPYQAFISAIYRAATPRAPMAIVAGHEHSLQVHKDGLGLHYLLSGAGSANKVNRVEKQKGFRGDWLKMAAALPGYMRLDAYSDGSLGATVFALDVGVFPLDVLDDEEPARPIYRTCLADGPPSKPKLR